MRLGEALERTEQISKSTLMYRARSHAAPDTDRQRRQRPTERTKKALLKGQHTD